MKARSGAAKPARQFRRTDDRVWMNTAHQGILPRVAADAACEAIAWKRRPHRMTSELFVAVPGSLRRVLARLLAVSESEIVLANSSSYGLHLLANGIDWRAGDEVLVFKRDFPSSILPWLGLKDSGVRVRFIDTRSSAPTPEDVRASLTARTRVVCLSWVQSFTGHMIDIGRIGEACRANGTHFVLNASQGIGARRLSPASLPIDAVTCVGFKWLCGPYGTGFAWIRSDLLETLRYNQQYWLSFMNAADLERDALPDTSRDVGGRRYDVFGTANFFNFTAWRAAIDLLLEIGLDAVEARNAALVERFLDGLPRDRFELLSPESGRQRSAIISLSHRDDGANGKVREALQAAGVDVAVRRGRLRLSPHFYNTAEDIDRALNVLRKLRVS